MKQNTGEKITHSPTQSELIEKGWNEKAKTYWTYRDGERAKLPASFENFYMDHRTEFKDALDIGCGSGKFLISMVQDGLNVIGLDIADRRTGTTSGWFIEKYNYEVIKH